MTRRADTDVVDCCDQHDDARCERLGDHPEADAAQDKTKDRSREPGGRRGTLEHARHAVQGNADERTKFAATTYIANCAMCHGQDGKKMYRDAQDLSVSSLNNEAVRLAIKDGSKGKMPAFASTLTEDEIAATATYVVTLRRTTPQ